jgi:hypothetical protein
MRKRQRRPPRPFLRQEFSASKTFRIAIAGDCRPLGVGGILAAMPAKGQCRPPFWKGFDQSVELRSLHSGEDRNPGPHEFAA